MNIYNKYFITNEEVLYKCKQLSTSFQQFYYNNYERKKKLFNFASNRITTTITIKRQHMKTG